jgi:nitrate/TMAO reductase-like tetraheme cytochrome c subunit
VAGPLLTLAWWFGGYVVSPVAATIRPSHGPLADAHASFEHECEKCHDAFRARGTETWPAPILGPSFLSTDAKCIACHQGPSHHDSMMVRGKVPSCASCHRDHRGREASWSARRTATAPAATGT